MENIWKYELPLTPDIEIQVPKDSLALYVGVQRNVPYIWFAIREEFKNELVPFRLKLALTGRSVDLIGCEHLGTFMCDNGTFVGHVFVPRTRRT